MIHKMLHYERIDGSEDIDANKTGASKKYIIWHCWYFLDKWLRLQTAVSNFCHNVLIALILTLLILTVMLI